MKKIIEKLKRIGRYCAEHDQFCSGCHYFEARTGDGPFDCKVMNAVDYLRNLNPEEWDMTKVEEILK